MKSSSGPRRAGRQIAGLLKGVRAKHGHEQIDLFLRWDKIVGPEWAQKLKPLRIAKKAGQNVLVVGHDASDAFSLNYGQGEILALLQDRFPGLTLQALVFRRIDMAVPTQSCLEVVPDSPSSLEEALQRLGSHYDLAGSAKKR
jgi:Uncharacterized protein conserved in bacteria